MKSNNRTPSLSSAEVLEGRFALRVTARLNESADALPHDVSQRLRVARQQALQAAMQSRVAASPASKVQQSWGWVLTLAGGGQPGRENSSWWQRAAAVLPLVVLVAGLLGIQELHSSRLISAAAEIDAALLADDLPPDAYQDEGFLEFIKRPPAEE